jgi:hypothetical protein
VTDREVDEALEKAARVAHELPAALLTGIAGAIKPSLRPVRPLPSSWVLTAGLVAVSAAVGLIGAARVGLAGVTTLSRSACALILGSLLILMWLAAGKVVSSWIPGSRNRTSAAAVLLLVSIALVSVFGLVFHDYRTTHFAAAGLTCLRAGLLHAVVAAVLALVLLRRGLAVSPASAGLAAGVLAGLAGVTMLELQCTNFEALHVLVWHTLVVPLGATAGAALGWLLDRVRDQ